MPDPLVAASAGALADAQAANQPPAAPSAAPPEAAPPSAEATPAGQPEPHYEVKVDGKAERLPLSEVLKGYQRDADYRKKTMELADQRRQLEATWTQMQAREQELATFLQDQGRIKQYLTYLEAQSAPAAPQPPKATLDDIPTADQVQALMQQEAQRLQADTESRINQAKFELEANRYESEYSRILNTSIDSLLNEHEVLKDIDDIDTLLRQDVLKHNPADIEEAKSLLADAAKTRAQKLTAKLAEREKMAAVRAAKLTQHGIEPPGGAGPTPTAAGSYKLGDPRLTAEVVEFVRQSVQRK